MELLVQLKEELGRLYIAGSKNAVNDPRIKKYIEPLEKLSEKSKIFEALKVGVQGLVEGTEEDSFANISKVYALVNSVLTTQIEFSYDGSEVEQLRENEKVFENVVSYKTVENCYKNYRSNAWSRTNDVEFNEIVDIINKDCRVYKHIDRYFQGANRLDYLDRDLVAVDTSLAYYFLNNYKSKNNLGCLDRLEYIHYKFQDHKDVFDNRVIPLAKDILNSKFAEVVPEAIKIIGHNEENKDLILEFSKHKKQEYVYASLTALYIMGVEEFNVAFKNLSETNLFLCSEILVKLATIKKDKSALENAADIILDKYLELMDDKEINFKSRKTYVLNQENALAKFGEVISLLSYDKYHQYFEKLFNKEYMLHIDLDWSYFEESVNNLVANDIRYNKFIFDKLTTFFNENQNKIGKLFTNSNQFYYYYLLVIKNLFEKEEVNKLTMEFIEYTKNNDMLAVRFRLGKNSDYSPLLKFISNSIEIQKEHNFNSNEKRRLRNNNFKLKDFNDELFSFLFYDTYFFQAVIGEDRSSNAQIIGVVSLLAEYFKTNSKALEYYVEKSQNFLTQEIDNCIVNNNVKFCEKFNYQNYLMLDSEVFARLFFDTLHYLKNNVKKPDEFESIMKGFRWTMRGNNIDVHYLRYKYILDEEKYKSLNGLKNYINL